MKVPEDFAPKTAREISDEADVERWAPFPGCDDRYEISTHGNVRHIHRKVIRKTSLIKNYPSIGFVIDGKKKTMAIHRRVLMAFERMPLPGEEACHNDGDTRNVRLSNLRWDTHAGNEADKKLHGTANGNHRTLLEILPKEDIDNILRLLGEGKTQTQVADIFGLRQSAVSRIKRRALKDKEVGKPSPRKRMRPEDAIRIRALHESGVKTVEIAQSLGLHRNHVGNIIRGRRWKGA